MAEMYGKANGSSRGRGGSMHIFDAARRFYGGNAIVGGGLPIAVGLALADRMQQRARVTACFFGEGAVAEGEFHESLNLAALWHLPVLFLCENNRYAMGTALARSESTTAIHAKAASYGIVAGVVEGMDVLAVEAAAKEAAVAVRAGDGPRFLEFATYRFRAHSMADPELYRSRAEVDEWKRRDPIATFAALLRAEGVLADADWTAMETSVAGEVERAVAVADAGPWEPVEDLTRDVYTPGEPG
jgi:TPP-dependent pyruvate/acetoin dehydrogenase alpha subunit